MAESAGNQLLSALTEGREKGNSKATTKKGKSPVKSASSGKVGKQGSNRSHRGVVSGGQTVTSSSSKRKFLRQVE